MKKSKLTRFENRSLDANSMNQIKGADGGIISGPTAAAGAAVVAVGAAGFVIGQGLAELFTGGKADTIFD